MSVVGTLAPVQDAVLLLNTSTAGNTSNSSNATTGAPIDTNGQGFIVWEVTGNAAFQMTIEGSNDLNFWSAIWTLPVSEVSQVDTINQNGHYHFETASRYIRYNIASCTSNLNFTVYGRAGGGPSAADRISQALDSSSNVALSVAINNLKKDQSGALVESDAVGPFQYDLLSATTFAIIDTTGYFSIVIQQQAGGASPVTISNDGLSWIVPQGVNLNSGAVATTLAAGPSIFAFGCNARFIRIGGTATPGSITVYLRSNPILGTSSTAINITQFAGTGVVNSGLAGSLGVGGSVAAAGSVAAQNPVNIGGSDNANLGRRLLVVDPASKTSFGGLTTPASVGALVTGGIDQANNTQIVSFLSGSFQNIPGLAVRDINQTGEGLTVLDILQQILLELQILNHYTHQLPLLLNNGINQSLDEPGQLRDEQSLFNSRNN